MTVLRRRPGIASVATLGGMAAVLVLAHAVAPEWSRSAGLDVWNLAAVEAERDDQDDRRAELEARHQSLCCQIGVADYLRRRLVEGEVTLADAADEVLRVNRYRSEFLLVLQLDYPAATSDRELAARYLILKVADLCHDDPPLRAAATGRLEMALHALKAAN